MSTWWPPPHANDRYVYDRQELSKALDHLRALTGGKPRLSLGCDFHLSYENVQDALTRPDWYTIDGTQYMLVELSNYGIPQQIEDYFSKLGDNRNSRHHHPSGTKSDLAAGQATHSQMGRAGCIVQVTASALTGSWGERAWRTAAWLFEHQAVHVLATDAHDTKNRIPVLSTARKEVEEVVWSRTGRCFSGQESTGYRERAALALLSQSNSQLVIWRLRLPVSTGRSRPRRAV